MSRLAMTVVTKDYDHVAPLASGDVVPDGIDLTLDRRMPMDRAREDRSVGAFEMSFSQYLIRTAAGEREVVGLPLFVYRSFRHRCFFVRRDSGLTGLRDLAGKRIGTNGWPDTGNTWSRAALREQGVDIDQISWTVGPVDDPAYSSTGNRPRIDLPGNVRNLEAGRTLRELLLAGELDALMCPWPPAGFYEPDSRIVRLIPDFRRAERDYFTRVGFYPGQHIMALRRPVFEQDPWVAGSLFRAFEAARLAWQRNRHYLADTTPWLLAEIEESMALLGADWQPNGVEPNRAMIRALCDEEYAQGLVRNPIDPNTVFAEFEQALNQGQE